MDTKIIFLLVAVIVMFIIMLISIKREKDKDKKELTAIKAATGKNEEELKEDLKSKELQIPMNIKALKITMGIGLASSFLFFILIFFPFGKIAGESTPTILDFALSYLGKELPNYNQFLVPVKNLSAIATVGGLSLLLTEIIKLVYFLKAKSNDSILSFYLSALMRQLVIFAIAIFTGASLLICNNIAVNDFLIESSFIYFAITAIATNLISSIVEKRIMNKYYLNYYKETLKISLNEQRKKSVIPTILLTLILLINVLPAATSWSNNIYSKGFESKLYPNFPTYNHFSAYDADFDKEPSIILTSGGEGSEVTCYSNNYCYYMARLEALEKEITGSWSFDEMQEKILLKDKLEDNLEKLEYGYMYLKYTSNYEKIPNSEGYRSITIVNEVIYDTNKGSDTEKKWGADKKLRNFSFKENIELEETTFEQGTDFSNINLGVKIYYNDGSMHLYYVNPENASELNEAEPGTYSFEWSDEWGEYSVDIIIK